MLIAKTNIVMCMMKKGWAQVASMSILELNFYFVFNTFFRLPICARANLNTSKIGNRI